MNIIYDMIVCSWVSILSKFYSKGHLAGNNRNQNSRSSSLENGNPRGGSFFYILQFFNVIQVGLKSSVDNRLFNLIFEID
jgi:hypothetical protein